MKKWFFIIFFSLVLIAAFVGYRYYSYIFLPNVSANDNLSHIYIPTNSSLDDLIINLSQNDLIEDSVSFRWVADKMSFSRPKPGRFAVADQWSNRELIQHLRSGRQEALKLTFNNFRKLDELSNYFGEQLEASSEEFYDSFLDSSTLERLGFIEEEMMTLFIPNTYELYWNTSPQSMIERMQKEYKRFWNDERKTKAEKIGLSPTEVYIMASIIQKETNLQEEKPRIAGLYLNRIEQGIPLQADPTVIYAIGDFEIRRVLNKQLEFESPYNTYLNKGLPPGPIGMPDISTIDAVLNAEDNEYLYFCVSPGNSMKHAFAKNLTQHNANARKYHRWLNSQKIYK